MSDPNTPPVHPPSSHPDPLTGEPGAHPVGTGVGAAGAGAAGAAIGGAVGGPVGLVAGTAVGAVIGGLAGKGVAESIDPTNEAGYWQANHANQHYAIDGSYERYSGAYRAGYEGAARHGADKTYDEAESDLKSAYESTKEQSGMVWDRARHAVRAAYERAQAGVKKVP